MPQASVSDTNAISAAVRRGTTYLAQFQTREGSLKGNYDGPLFLVPMFVFAHYATRRRIAPDWSDGFRRSMLRSQNGDGGFPLHVEGESYLFTTVFNYIALRMLGVSSSATERARLWILAHGGAANVPSWGKYWLAILRLYRWEGVNPVIPELLLLPKWFPAHPSRFWCHARVIYLAVSYLYGRRWQVPEDGLLAQLRTEIYERPYIDVEFAGPRDAIAETDLRVPHSWSLRVLNAALCRAESWIPQTLRERALRLALDHIHYEQLTTSFIDIGPVNKALDAVACHAAEPDSAHTQKALEALDAYVFEGESGLVVQAYNSSELWDTAFAIRAVHAAKLVRPYSGFVNAACGFLDANQVLEDPPEREKYFRDPARGGWPFSNKAHGWPIVDCTAEALMAAIETRANLKNPIAADRLLSAVDLILQWQNNDGGWPTYERCRGSPALERLNPSEMFRNIMIDRSSVELTSAALQALASARGAFGNSLGTSRLSGINLALRRGTRYLREAQRPDGSWKGSWGICFTYGTWFGVWALLACGVPSTDAAIARAARFVLSKQRVDGGWSESYRSCIEDTYIEHPDGTQPVMTAWALLTLLVIDRGDMDRAIKRGVHWLVDHQRPDGDWRQSGMTGVFNETCMLNYRFYRNYFPIWALALFQRHGL